MPEDQTESACHITWHEARVARADRPTRGMTVWITGLSGAGKSTLACELEWALVQRGQPAYRLDGDNLRHHLNADLGFTTADRAENVRRLAEVARLFADAGTVAIVAAISPLRESRDAARKVHACDQLPFWEVYVDTPLNVCEQRDPKGLYAKARSGQLANFTGIDAVYEAPISPEYTVKGGTRDPHEAAERLSGLISDSLR